MHCSPVLRNKTIWIYQLKLTTVKKCQNLKWNRSFLDLYTLVIIYKWQRDLQPFTAYNMLTLHRITLWNIYCRQLYRLRLFYYRFTMGYIRQFATLATAKQSTLLVVLLENSTHFGCVFLFQFLLKMALSFNCGQVYITYIIFCYILHYWLFKTFSAL